uniref:Uncharacterized protein n=1 Tax=Anguilla anguilla TaxID=7936 RepID=A0A0E9QDT2_ANGAN
MADSGALHLENPTGTPSFTVWPFSWQRLVLHSGWNGQDFEQRSSCALRKMITVTIFFFVEV